MAPNQPRTFLSLIFAIVHSLTNSLYRTSSSTQFQGSTIPFSSSSDSSARRIGALYHAGGSSSGGGGGSSSSLTTYRPPLTHKRDRDTYSSDEGPPSPLPSFDKSGSNQVVSFIVNFCVIRGLNPHFRFCSVHWLIGSRGNGAQTVHRLPLPPPRLKVVTVGSLTWATLVTSTLFCRH